MINLIPIEKRKKIIKEFYLRFLAVLFFMCGTAGLIITASFLPAYFSANVKMSVVSNDLEEIKKDTLSEEELAILEVMDDFDKKFEILSNDVDSRYIVSEEVIDSIILRKPKTIKINRINYKSDLSGDSQILIIGEAQSRESLLDFRVNLEREPAWEDVDLPVSNFVKDSDIDFSLTLTPVK